MKNKKGFTLVELLAVVVVLGIIGSIVTTSVMKIKKKASDDVFSKLKKEIEDLGPEIYTHEMLSGDKNEDESFYNMYKNNTSFIITIDDLKAKGYLDDVKSPYKTNEVCIGCLKVSKNDGEPEFSAFLSCGKHKSASYEDDSCAGKRAVLSD